jgi:glycoside/pentoside/hexuronide:cation symporter, GPH family
MANAVSVREKVAYALGDTAANFVWRAVIVFLPFFLTDAAGISPAAVGVLLLVCRVWDGVMDLAMGAVADRTHTRWGKFRPWILWSAAPLAVCAVLTFSAPELGETGRLVYAYVTYGALVACYTMNNVPYNALMGVMSSSPVERGTISSYRFFFAFLGGLLIQGCMPPLLSALDNLPAARFLHALYENGPAFGYTAAMTLFSGVALILFVITFAATRERVRPPIHQRSDLKQDFADLLHNGPWLVLFAVGLLFVTFTTLKNGAIMYYFTYYVGDVELAGLFMVVGLLGAMAGAATTGPLIRVIGKHRLMLYALGIAIASSALLYLARPTDVSIMIVLSTLTEVSTGPMVALFFAMLADAADYSEWRTNRRATGLCYSAGTVAMKVGSGVGGAATGLLLAAFGYVAASGQQAVVEQSAEAVQGIRLLISVLPAAVALLMLVAFLFYRLDDQQLAQIEGDLAVRRPLTQ